jgi:hypothetical protein
MANSISPTNNQIPFPTEVLPLPYTSFLRVSAVPFFCCCAGRLEAAVGQRAVPGSGGSLAETKDILPAAAADLLPHQASQASPRQAAPIGGHLKRSGLLNPDFCLFCVSLSKDCRLFDKKLTNMTNRTTGNFTMF